MWPRTRPWHVVLVCDVSCLTHPQLTIYLYSIQAMVLRQAWIYPKVFAFSTSLIRLTSVLAHRSVEVALDWANA
ncbi:VWA domain-containing protein [Mycobacterium lepromatosis]|uniref:VWA domain-containing protein n=1 Tax=Mycobacterium lepromatosis TaxID=480418 RepID=UPI000AC51B4E|nr:VWA domain-containing protein [Mycobacterium lepromatosis]